MKSSAFETVRSWLHTSRAARSIKICADNAESQRRSVALPSRRQGRSGSSRSPRRPVLGEERRGAWSIPKGEAQPQEDLLAVAVREVREETGFEVAAPFVPLSPVKQSGKIVHAWACEFDGDAQ